MNMWKTVSARIRGADTELKEMGEDTDGMVTSSSKLQALIKGMTGFDIMESDGKTFKDVYDIIIGIGEKWNDLSDINRASLLEKLAGKNQSNALAAAISQVDVLKKSYEEATNAEGSAREENEEYAKSIQASINLAQTKLEELANDLLSSNFLKGLIDLGGTALDIINGLFNGLQNISSLGGNISSLGGILGTVGGLVQSFTGHGAVKYDSENGFSGIALDVVGALRNKISGKGKELPELNEATKEVLSWLQEDDIKGLNKNQLKEFFDDDTIKSINTTKKSFMSFLDEVDLSGDVFTQYQNHLKESSQSMTLFQRAGKAAGTAVKSLVATAGSMLVSWGVGELLSAAISGIDYFANKIERTAESASNFTGSIKDFQSELSTNNEQIDDLSKKYKELSNGVSDTGQNLTLTSDQYSDYKDTVSKLSDLMPDLTTQFNEQGEKIGFVGGKLDDVNKKYKEYIKNKAKRYISDGDEDGNTFSDVLNDFNNENEPGEHSYSKGWRDIISGVGKGATFGLYQGDLGSELFGGTEGFGLKEQKDILDKLKGIKSYEWQNTLDDSWFGDNNQVNLVEDLLDVDVDEVYKMTDKEYSELQKKIVSKIQSIQSKLDVKATQIASGMQTMITANDDYWDIEDEDVRNGLSSLVSSFNYDTLTNLGIDLGNQDDIQSWIDSIVSDVKSNKGKINEAIVGLFKIDTSKLDPIEAKKLIDGYINVIINELKANGKINDEQAKTILNAIKKSFGFDDVDEKEKSYKNLLNQSFNKKTKQKSYDKDGNVKEEYLYDGKRASEIFQWADKNNVTEEEIRKIKENGDSYGSTIEDLNNALMELRGEADKANKKSFSKAWSDLDNVDSKSDMTDTKKELLSLAEAGKLTKKTFKNVKGSDSFLDLMGLKEKDIEKVNKQINKIVDSVKQLSSLKTGISAITSAYDEKKESKKNTVSSSTLNSLGDTLGVSEWNEKDKKVWENYKDTAGNSKKSLSQLKDAQDELASSYANSNNFLANLNSQNKNYYISLLKEMGVVNAEEIVTKKLRKEQKNLSIVKKELGYESEDLNDSTVSEISRMYDSETASKAAKNAMFDLTLEKIRNGQVKISTAADCTALLNMAQAAGIALSKLKELTNASIEMNLAERQTKDADSLQDALNSGRKTYVSSSGSVLKASESKLAHLRNMSNSNRLKAQKNIDKYAKKHKDDYKLNIELTKGNKSNGSKGKNKGSRKDKSKSTQVIDWIERKLDRLNTKLDLVKAKYDNLPSSSKSSAALLNAENKNLDDQIKILKKVQSVNNKSYSKYMKKAKKSATYTIGKGKKKKTYKLSKSLKKKIRNGRIKGSYKKLIATYGEPKANAIQKYQDYYDKAQSSKKNSQDAKKSITDTKIEKLTNAQNYYDTLNAMNQAYESTAKGLSKNNYVQEQIEATKQSYDYQIKIAKAQGDYNKKKQLEQEKEKATLDLQRQKVENIKTFYDYQVGLLDNDKQDIQNQIDLIEARGDIISRGYYKNLTNEDNAIIAKREAELKDLKSQLSTKDQGTDNWYELQNDIQSVENEINEHKKSVYENTKAIGELNDKMYEAIYAVSSNLNAELDTIGSLKRGEVSDSDTGTLTDTGFLQLYAAGLSYSATKGTAAEANARLAEIINANKSGKVLEGYTSLQAQKDAEAQLAKDAQDQVTSVKSYGDKIIEIIKDAISSVVDHLQEIIDARKEALNEEKDLRDYERSILEKTKNVSSLQKQFMAVSGDTSEEGRLKAAQLRKSLDEAQQDLQDTEYDRYISDQQEMLDNMMNQFQDLMEKLQKDEDALLREGIKAINDQKGVMQQIFNKTAEEYGYPTSTNLTELQTALTTGRITADIINSAKDDSVTSVIKTEAEKIVKAYGDAKSGTGGGTSSTGGNNSNGGDGGTKNNNSSKGQQTQTNNGQTTIKPNVASELDKKNTTKAEKEAIDKENKIRAALNKIKGAGYEVFWTDKKGTPKSITNQRISAEPNYDRVYKNAKGKTVRVPQILTEKGLKWLASKLGIKRSELNSYVKSSAFATGGIAKIKPVGEDGIAWVRNGEGFVRPEDVQHIRDLMAVTPDLTKLVSSFSNQPNVKPLDKNVTKNVSIDHITFELPNVQNTVDFTDTIKTPSQQKAFAAAIGDAFNGKKLNINRY